jgi:hypothetical protein
VQSRRGRVGTIVAGVVVIAGGVAVAVVELLQLARGSVWLVAAATVALVALIRGLTARRR